LSLFEYLAIAFSLVFSFSAMRLIAGFPHAFASHRRYWVHVGLVSFQLLATVGIFWAFWSYRDLVWTFPTFVLVLASPCLNYYNTCALIPEDPASVESWRAYFYSIRRRYFVGFASALCVQMIIDTLVVGQPALHPARGVQVGWLVGAITGALSASHSVQAAIAVWFMTLLMLMGLTLGLLPGSFAPP
jgi:hypothetical protein